MKPTKFLLTALLVAAALTATGPYVQAQDTREEFYINDGSSTTARPRGQTRYNIRFNRNRSDNRQVIDGRLLRFGLEDGHWSGVTLNYNGLVSSIDNLYLPEGLEDMRLKANSIGVAVNFADLAIPIFRRMALITGVGVEFNNFRFNKDIGLKKENGYTIIDYQYIDRGIPLKMSKLTTSYLNIPLLLEFQFGRNHDTFINAGVVGGWRMGAHTKIKANHPELDGKFKEWSNVTLQNFHYGYTVNIGHDSWGVSATYYPGSIFQKGTGPHIEHVNVGVSFFR